MTAAVCRRPSLLEDHVERNLVGIRGACPSTVLNHLSSFRKLFSWRKKVAEYENGLSEIRPPDFASDVMSVIDHLYVSELLFYLFKLLLLYLFDHCMYNVEAVQEIQQAEDKEGSSPRVSNSLWEVPGRWYGTGAGQGERASH